MPEASPAPEGGQSGALPAPASRHALALLRFPDPRTDWVVVTVASLQTPIDDLDDRLRELHRAVPIVGARLRDEVWHPGSPPEIPTVAGDLLAAPDLDRPFDLTTEAPLRLLRSADGSRLAVVGHHAAFDGLALVAVLRALTAGELPQPVDSPPPGVPGSKLPLLARLARPADRVAPSIGVHPGDSYATATIAPTGRGITGRLAAAAVDAVGAHNARAGERLAKVGITVAVGGPAGVGNVASYRRIDVAPRDDVAAAVQAALAIPEEPGEQVSAPKLVMRMLEPVVERFSDTILVSNLGRHAIDGVERLDFFPVARGRSAVCFASAAVEGAQTSFTVRARDLGRGDARRLLDEACVALERSAG
jgi:hypothetical protein